LSTRAEPIGSPGSGSLKGARTRIRNVQRKAELEAGVKVFNAVKFKIMPEP
jgi:hypothetical protein